MFSTDRTQVSAKKLPQLGKRETDLKSMPFDSILSQVYVLCHLSKSHRISNQTRGWRQQWIKTPVCFDVKLQIFFMEFGVEE